jgi:DNA-binding NarL/FixJ family response regulator
MSKRTNILSIAQHEVIRILTVDDHQLLREGIVAVLERQEDMRVVGQAGSGREAIESFRRLRPDVTLMDLRMPDMSGLEAISIPTAKLIRVRYCGHAHTCF